MSHFVTGRKSSINSTPAQLTTTSALRADIGVQIYATSTNTANVFIGESGMTIDSADATDGFPLTPGDSILVPIRNPEDIYVASSGSGQKVFFLVR